MKKLIHGAGIEKRAFSYYWGIWIYWVCVIRELINDDLLKFVILINLSSSNTKSFDTSSVRNYQFKKIDIADAKSINKAVIEFKPDYILHLAAETHVDRSIDRLLNLFNQI